MSITGGKGVDLSAPVFELRAYQREAVENVHSSWQAHPDVLGVMATGGGKTQVYLQVLDDALAANPSARCLIIAHRKELIEQPVDRIAQFFPHLLWDTGIVMADKDEPDRRITVATVQTLATPARLERILSYGPIDYVVTDEAQHAVAPTYLRVYERLRAANPNLLHLGVTATPKRTDREGLRKVFGKPAFRFGIKELIDLGYLVPMRALAVQTGISLRGIKTNDEGDFVEKDLANVWECDNAFDLIVESHQRYAGDRLSMVFTVSVKGAYGLAAKFRAAGIPAEACDGTTAKRERAKVLERFRRGETRVLVNVALWTEGLDVPEIACVHMARPTKSDLVYVQALGRGLRQFPGKEDCLVLDYAPVEDRDVMMAGDVLGKPREQKLIEEEATKRGVIIAGFTFTGEGTGIDGDPDELVTRPLLYFTNSKLAWFPHQKLSVISLGERDELDRTLAILPPGGSKPYRLVEVAKKRGSWGQPRVTVLGIADNFEALADQGEQLALREGAEQLIRRDRRWMAEPPTPKQLGLLRRFYPDGTGDDGRPLSSLSKGEASKLITWHFCLEGLVKAGWKPDVPPRVVAPQNATPPVADEDLPFAVGVGSGAKAAASAAAGSVRGSSPARHTSSAA